MPQLPRNPPGKILVAIPTFNPSFGDAIEMMEFSEEDIESGKLAKVVVETARRVRDNGVAVNRHSNDLGKRI